MVKILVRAAGVAVVLVAVAYGAVYSVSERRMGATFDVPVVAVETSTDSAVLARGAHVARIRGCTDCHAEDLGGRTFADAMPMGILTGANLTSGRNGVGGTYSDADWVRAIRSAVRPDGTALLFMPSYEYRSLGPEDLGALVSWLKSAPPVDSEPIEQVVGPLGRLLFVTGRLPLVPAEMIDHADTRFEQPARGVTTEYGAYLATSCVGCHGPTLTGGRIPGTPPDWPAASNLTPDEGTGIGSWSKEHFLDFARTGNRPDGRRVDPTYMPWPALQAMTDEEREALWLYLRSLPPAAAEG